jgi:hypothetical protein
MVVGWKGTKMNDKNTEFLKWIASTSDTLLAYLKANNALGRLIADVIRDRPIYFKLISIVNPGLKCIYWVMVLMHYPFWTLYTDCLCIESEV